MAKKTGAREPGLPPKRRENARKTHPLIIAGVAVVVVAAGAFLLWPGERSSPSQASAHESGAAHGSAAPSANERAVTNAATKAAFGPHKQASYPPIPFQGYEPPRPKEVITSAYQFAAEHPEITSYVPCFCGCERQGHEGNTDCFVKSRAENGDVIAWDEHGVECAVCIDVANRSRQMHAAGASPRDIRTAIDKEFGTTYPGKMPTPHPPARVTQQ
jgi:hypothetical protein